MTEMLEPPTPRRARGLTRRQLLAGTSGGALALAGAGFGIDRLIAGSTSPAGLGPNGTPQRFVSRPDLVPTITRQTLRGRPAPGLWFVGPDRSPPVHGGGMIIDGHNDLVWFHPITLHHWVTNLQVRSLHGRPVLTWWEGTFIGGYGAGEAVIADTSYRELHRIRAGNGRTIDLHEFQLTDSGRALFTCTPQTATADLSGIGGPSSAHVLESIFQEVDVSSGRLIQEWKSLDHISVDETYRQGFAPLDYLHLNAIDVLDDGDLLISARNTWAVYKLDRSSGRVIWRLGGKRSDFRMGPGAQFAWEHDGRWVGPGRMTVFDDGFDGVTRTHRLSRALVLSVSERSRRVSVARAFTSPTKLLTSGMGNAQLLPDGHMLVGFGDDPSTTEFAADGSLVANLQMPSGQHSYRGFRLPWTATPAEAPAVAVRRDRSSRRSTLYVSWNGATEVAAWHVLAGSASRSGSLRPVARARRAGFETAVDLGTSEGVAVAVAIDARGRELGRSARIAV